MVLKNKNSGIFKIKINVGRFFSDEENPCNNEDFYIVLREPTSEEALSMKNTAEDEKEMFKTIPNYMVDHSFESETGKMTNKEVWDMIYERSGAATYVVSEWGNNIPLAKENKKKQAE